MKLVSVCSTMARTLPMKQTKSFSINSGSVYVQLSFFGFLFFFFSLIAIKSSPSSLFETGATHQSLVFSSRHSCLLSFFLSYYATDHHHRQSPLSSSLNILMCVCVYFLLGETIKKQIKQVEKEISFHSILLLYEKEKHRYNSSSFICLF